MNMYNRPVASQNIVMKTQGSFLKPSYLWNEKQILIPQVHVQS